MSKNESESLQELLAIASKVTMTAADKEEQRRSFAYGNTRIENEYVTREMIGRLAETVGVPGKR